MRDHCQGPRVSFSASGPKSIRGNCFRPAIVLFEKIQAYAIWIHFIISVAYVAFIPVTFSKNHPHGQRGVPVYFILFPSIIHCKPFLVARTQCSVGRGSNLKFICRAQRFGPSPFLISAACLKIGFCRFLCPQAICSALSARPGFYVQPPPIAISCTGYFCCHFSSKAAAHRYQGQRHRRHGPAYFQVNKVWVCKIIARQAQ